MNISSKVENNKEVSLIKLNSEEKMFIMWALRYLMTSAREILTKKDVSIVSKIIKSIEKSYVDNQNVPF